ncbi:MAG: shikimate kinase AroK [Methylococcaceae bacterium]|jgi:shikimate kinase
MRQSTSIFLIGPMGAGKSTIGRLLAKTLEIDFFDSDKEIEKRTGVTIPMIFEYEGEQGFRKREAEVIADLTAIENTVLATGGGSVLLPENRACLRENGYVVYLHCPVEKQMERTHKDTNRPLLKTDDPHQKLIELFTVREPIYRQMADFVVDTGQASSRTIVRQILMAHGRANPGHHRL